MANIYDVNRMKSGVSGIEKQMKTYHNAKVQMDRIMADLDQKTWDDDNYRRFYNRYQREAKPAAEELEKTIDDIVKLLQQCAKKYSNAIDNGNSRLSSQ